MLTSLTSTFLNPNLNYRQVRRHIFQHTYFSNQVAGGKKRAEMCKFLVNFLQMKRLNAASR